MEKLLLLAQLLKGTGKKLKWAELRGNQLESHRRIPT
jgi:hypothetical protein